ncbi:MAG: DUF4249 family protein [Bacteroidota bacterium]
MTYILKNLLLLILFLSYFSCVDEIDLAPDEDRLEAVAVNGKIIKGNPSIISVLVQPIFTFTGESRVAVPVNEVYLQNQDGQKYIIENEVAIGQYEQVIDPTFEIAYDQKYQLIVQLADGRVYESSFVQVLRGIAIQSLDFEVVPQDRLNPITNNLESRDFIQYNITTPLTETSSSRKAFLYWSALKTNRYFIESGVECYTTQSADVNYVGVFNGSSISSDTLSEFPIFRDLIDKSFMDTYYFTILQETISEAAYQYWNQINLSINRDGNVFEPTVGLIRTNIRNASGTADNVQGFFYATEQSRFRIRICPNEVNKSFRSQICNGCPCQLTTPPTFWRPCD